MRTNLNFKNISIRNFMSVQNEIKVDFQKMNGVIFVEGDNQDAGTDSNGAGKSLLIEAILFAIYGKTIRGLTPNEVINTHKGKHCRVIVEVGDLTIERSRKPNHLKLFCGAEDLTLSTMPRTQELIIEKIGVDYTTFCQIFCFGQHNLFSFVSADEKTRREIVENLLSLSDYNLCLERTRETLRNCKSEIKLLVGSLSAEDSRIADLERRISTYIKSAKEKREEIEKKIRDLEKSRESLSPDDLRALEEKWNCYNRATEENNHVLREIDAISEELIPHKTVVSNFASKKEAFETELKKIAKLESGAKCKFCFSPIDPGNAKPHLDELEANFLKKQREAKIASERKAVLENYLSELRALSRELTLVEKPSLAIEKLRAALKSLETIDHDIEIQQKALSEDLYRPLIEEAEKHKLEILKAKKEIENKIRKKEELLPYLEFWVEGFGSNGIRSFIVENVIEFLNNQINYWLQFLIDNQILVKFDKYLNIDIRRTTDTEINYKQGSGGEKRRIDLAISLAFADLMRISNGAFNNLLFLDEVVDSLDSSGVNGVSQLINELSKERIIFVISHNPLLRKSLEHFPKIKMIKKDEITTISLPYV